MQAWIWIRYHDTERVCRVSASDIQITEQFYCISLWKETGKYLLPQFHAIIVECCQTFPDPHVSVFFFYTWSVFFLPASGQAKSAVQVFWETCQQNAVTIFVMHYKLQKSRWNPKLYFLFISTFLGFDCPCEFSQPNMSSIHTTFLGNWGKGIHTIPYSFFHKVGKWFTWERHSETDVDFLSIWDNSSTNCIQACVIATDIPFMEWYTSVFSTKLEQWLKKDCMPDQKYQIIDRKIQTTQKRFVWSRFPIFSQESGQCSIF